MKEYDVIVIGAGHAGIEAALASSRMGALTLLVTLGKDTIGLMSCNPAIGGVGKGQLVKEIDALGGQMGLAADECGIQFRILNGSKGPAVHSSRAQIDMDKYKAYMRTIVQAQENLNIAEGEVKKIAQSEGTATGVVLSGGEEIASRTVIICPGTFLDGLLHVGLRHVSGGRIHEQASKALAWNLRELGFHMLRFKTGTCPRLDKATIDFSALTVQCGDQRPSPFSFSHKQLRQKQIPCHITHTNADTHAIIRKNLDRSPLYTGLIKATGVRYCPSIEDKIVKFADKQRHQIFLEPQGCESAEIYPNGLSTSLPEEVQQEIIHSIEGLREAKVTRFGYGIEHTVVEPTQLYPTLETKRIKNLYLAGQINGTTGYEEAAAQGLIAGINAALAVQKKEPLIVDRSSSYIGVLIDDLTTKGTSEPYRMFTSRVEYRLLLREDNADLRLSHIAFGLGLLSRGRYRQVAKKVHAIEQAASFLKMSRLKPCAKVNERLIELGTAALKKTVSLEEILRRPRVSLQEVLKLGGGVCRIPESALRQVEIEVKYAGFIQRQLAEVARFKNLEKIRLPRELRFSDIPGLSREIKEKLDNARPITLGQASRISGVTPAAISLLMVYLKKVAGGR